MALSRKQILQSKGFTCNNWYNNWSFINHKRRLVCFTGWVDLFDNTNGYLVLSDTWEIGRTGRRRPGYKVSLDYINEFIQGEGYGACILRHKAVDPNEEKRTIKEIADSLVFGDFKEIDREYFVYPTLR